MAYHYLTQGSDPYWDRIQTLIGNRTDQFWVTATSLYTASWPPVPASKVCLVESATNYLTNWQLMAQRIVDLLTNGPYLAGRPIPARVLMEEVKCDPATPNYAQANQVIAEVAQYLRLYYPSLAGRWGVNIQHPTPGNGMSDASPIVPLEQVVRGNGFLVSEQYYYHSWWCSDKNSGGISVADTELGDFFRGNRGTYPSSGLFWLLQYRASLGSSSHVSIYLGVGDVYMDKAAPYKFLDRMFYVFKQLFPGLTSAATNGGLGSYKWQSGYVTTTSRDDRYGDSWVYYCGSGTAYRYPATDC